MTASTTDTNTDLPFEFTGDTITVTLSFDNRGELVVRLPAQPNLKGGNVTIIRGTVEDTLRNILEVEAKIMRHEREGRFYGEPTSTQMARDIRRANSDTDTTMRSPTIAMDLEF